MASLKLTVTAWSCTDVHLWALSAHDQATRITSTGVAMGPRGNLYPEVYDENSECVVLPVQCSLLTLCVQSTATCIRRVRQRLRRTGARRLKKLSKTQERSCPSVCPAQNRVAARGYSCALQQRGARCFCCCERTLGGVLNRPFSRYLAPVPKVILLRKNY